MVGLLQASAEHQGLRVSGVLGAVGTGVRVCGRRVPAARGQGRRPHPEKARLGDARHIQRTVDRGQHHHRHGDPQAAQEAARPAGH